MNNEGHPSALALLPRDGFFLKDGRGWFTSESGRAGAVEWPFARTVRGAVRTCLGHRHEERSGQCLSADEWRLLNDRLSVAAVLPLCRGVGMPLGTAARRWPAPRDAVVFTGEQRVRALLPDRGGAAVIALNEDAETVAVENLRHPSLGDVAGKPAPMPVWWSDEVFTAWLCGMPVEASALASEESPTSRQQTHVTIDALTGAGVDGGLFSSTVVEPLSRSAMGGPTHEWAVAASGSGLEPADRAGRSVRLGGDGRLATCQTLPDDLFAMPAPLRQMFAGGPRGMRLVFVGHAGLEKGWLPSWLEARDGRIVGDLPGVGPVALVAACVGRPVHVSGWDMAARRPKPTRRLVPAGSVYFLEKVDGGAFTLSDAEAVWLRAVGEGSDTGEATGAVVPGVWKPA